jgi:proton-dependent oligopeptide transporter, POT family
MTAAGAEPSVSMEAAASSEPHPRGLYLLFATEMWERFSYYGMRALLVLYLINHLEWQPGEAANVYKWYTSLVYLMPLLGGFLADRYLGLRASIVIGAVLMTFGHFALAFEPLPFFYAGLGLLVLGNGFFKPNISTLVGKMYKKDDSRRDGAFTIFYMGINLGAFLSPIVCGALRVHYGFHYGFACAGVGMVLGLVTFLWGQGRVMADVHAAGNLLKGERAARSDGSAKVARAATALEEAKTEGTTGAAGALARAYPLGMIALAAIVPVYYGRLLFLGQAKPLDLVMPVAFAGIAGWMGVNLFSIKGAARDKSTVIFVLFAFAVLFWMAFEQAGNALNIFADVHTDLHLGGFTYPAEWFQSVNAILIFVIAPLFAKMWIWLDRRSIEPSTPMKMLIAMGFMTLSFAVMVLGAMAEDRTESRVPLSAVPDGIDLATLDAGRLRFDGAKGELVARGVVAPFAIHDALGKTVPPAFVASIDALEEVATKASAAAPVEEKLASVPAGFTFPWDTEGATKRGLAWDETSRTVRATRPLDAPTKGELLAAGAPSEWRTALQALGNKSQAARVSGLWLFLSYLFATLGELCLSPVGLSMVTKLAPVRFASLFMGVWLLSSSVAQYVGGSVGESWGKVPPVSYFWLFVGTSLVGGAALVLLVRPLKKLMHEVR